MDSDNFNKTLVAAIEGMSNGFVDAYNSTHAMQTNGYGITSVSVSKISDNPSGYHIETSFKGEKADLFARTFSSALKKSGVIPKRHYMLSKETGKNTDRMVSYDVSKAQATEFLIKISRMRASIEKSKDELAHLYDVGINAQTKTSRESGVATKFFVSVANEPVFDAKGDFLLELHTNNAALTKAAEEASGLSDRKHSIKISSLDRFAINEQSYPPENAVGIVAVDQKGNDAIEEAVKKLARNRGMGGGRFTP